ncbi:multidrug ABC transporter ATP-binding protein [Planctomycetaceae bacterium SCGC AG-212-F19]|nr:multidrug ABC transporter ATP-binding protein [Planctomycetaceae bacterium SCGC AG-212-F19]
MIHVRNLTKYYGDYAAVRDVSFDVAAGQIVGFLGPNGAGKTTTMRVLTGYMTATSGQASIAGFDVFWQPLEARRRIGYLPENCPLYTEMRVAEYLHFRAGLKGLAGHKRIRRCNYVMGKCWLNEVHRQLIGTLSKGFRQRVGLADALLADPPVLILDEPTAGLDPTQIRETRTLIRELGKEHTILLSTHILPEVEMTCDRVIIIHRGRVAASATMAELSLGTDGARVVLADVEGTIDKELVKKLPGVGEVTTEPIAGGTRLRVTQSGTEDVTPRLCGLAVECGWKLREIRAHRQSLEERFVRIVEGEEN